ncbi:MAG: hypothetical protein R3D25_06535 [Geminicoccaceae bacterium]
MAGDRGIRAIALIALVFFGAALRPLFLTLLLLVQQELAAWLGLPPSYMALLIGLSVLGTLMATVGSRLVLQLVGLRQTVSLALLAILLGVGCLVAGSTCLPDQMMLRVALTALVVFVVGLGTGLAATAMKIVVGLAGSQRRKEILDAAWSAGSPFGLCLGAAASNLHLLGSTWSSGFLVVLAATLLLLLGLLGSRRLDFAPSKSSIPADYLGLALICATLLLFELWSIWAKASGWDTPASFGLFLGMCVVGGVAIRHMKRTADAVLPLHPLRSRCFVFALVLCLIAEISTTQEFEFLFLEDQRGLPIVAMSERTVVGNFISFGAMVLAGVLLGRTRLVILLLVGLLVLTAGLASYLIYPIDSSDPVIVATRGLAGLGYGLLLPCILTLAHRDLGEKDRAAASALLVCVLLLGNDVGLSIFPIIIDVVARVYDVTTGYFVVFVIQTVLVASMMPLSILILKSGVGAPRPTCEHRPDP